MIQFHWLSVDQLLLQSVIFSLLIVAFSRNSHKRPGLYYTLWYLVILRHIFPFSIHITNHNIAFSANLIPVEVSAVITGSTSSVSLISYLPLIWAGISITLLFLFLINEIRFRHHLRTIPFSDTKNELHQLNLKNIRIRISEFTTIPFSYGIFKPVIVLPFSTLGLNTADLHSIIAHESAHIRYRDPLHNFIRRLIGIIWFFNPIIWLAQQRCEYYQEIRCDSESLNRTSISTEAYSNMLLNIIRKAPVPTLNSFALTRIDGNNSSLKARLIYINTNYVKGSSMKLSKMQNLAIGGFIILMIMAACSVNTQKTVNQKQVPIENMPPEPAGGNVKFIPYDVPPAPIGGNEAILKNVVYPDKAKQAGIEGAIVIQAYIDADGNVTDCKIMRGIPDSGLDEAAIAAIRKTKFRPAQQRDKYVGVWIAIPVVFKLSESKDTEEFDEAPAPVDGWQSLYKKVVYPQTAQEAKIEGTVQIRVTINEDGKVKEMTIEKGLPGTGLDQAALDAIKSTDFIPAKKDGKSVAVSVTIPVMFKLK